MKTKITMNTKNQTATFEDDDMSILAMNTNEQKFFNCLSKAENQPTIYSRLDNKIPEPIQSNILVSPQIEDLLLKKKRLIKKYYPFCELTYLLTSNERKNKKL